ncbi:MAG: methylated-DNA--[protein]-cysteine S-methyltransferase [Oligoflexus sp.]
MYYSKKSSTPVGLIHLIASDKGLWACLFESHRPGKVELPEDLEASHDHPILLQAENELQEYFAKKRQTFSVPLDFGVASAFRLSVWQSLLKIPYGQTFSYGEQAQKLLGCVKSVRAVAHANSKNRLAIIVPCHRVIAASGQLHGYAGGLDKKRQLLEWEGALGLAMA